MIIRTTDFNSADIVIAKSYKNQWREIETVLREMPLHLKASDQLRIQGRPIFDPVGINEYIKRALKEDVRGWKSNIPIPVEYAFLGTDVDFCKAGVLLEAQFSHYSFILNNLLRSELFFKSKTLLAGYPTGVVVVVTKAHMFPASNSTLYYEQAVNQLASLSKNKVFDVPIRLVGLFEQTGSPIQIKLTQYGGDRSRTVVSRLDYDCKIANATARGRCSLVIGETKKS